MQVVVGPRDEPVAVLETDGSRARVVVLPSGTDSWHPRSALSEPLDRPLERIGTALGSSGALEGVDAITPRGVGLVGLLSAVGPLSVRSLMGVTGCCESELLGLITELQAGGVIEETSVAGRRGYRLSERTGSELQAER
ncbi:MAG: hypothetical protein ABEJ27_01700 [Halodesulfurarchaeum sp.]